MRSIRLVAAWLDMVSIECLDWREGIVRYDTPQTLFYLDPPYHGREAGYGAGLFAPGDHAVLAERLHGCAGGSCSRWPIRRPCGGCSAVARSKLSIRNTR